MITVLSDISKIDISLASEIVEKHPFICDVVSKGKNEKTFCERVGGYLTLMLAYEKLFSSSLPKIKKNIYGKPRFEAIQKTEMLPCSDFNISHSDGMCAVSFLLLNENASDIGVDIQRYDEGRSVEKIENKLLNYVNNYLHIDTKVNFDIYFLDFDTDTFSPGIFDTVYAKGEKKSVNKTFFKDMNIDVDPILEYSFYNRWTALEALLKADGAGFESFYKIDEIQKNACISTFDVKYGSEKYSLSMALL